jgi:hypothetical protein
MKWHYLEMWIGFRPPFFATSAKSACDRDAMSGRKRREVHWVGRQFSDSNVDFESTHVGFVRN